MQLFEGYSAEELSRILTVSRWIFCVLVVVAAIMGFFTQWLGGQILAREHEERNRAVERLAAVEFELRQSEAKMKDFGATLGKLTLPRLLSESQLGKLRISLREGPRGPVIVSYLITEWDAEKYARQIVSLLIDTGFDAKVSEFLLANSDHDGTFLCASADGKLSPHGASIQSAFVGVGMNVEAHHAPSIVKETGAPEGAVVFVVSHRK